MVVSSIFLYIIHYMPIVSIILFDVRLFKSKSLLLVDNFQNQAENEGGDTQTSQHDKRGGIVELRRVGNTFVGAVENLTDK